MLSRPDTSRKTNEMFFGQNYFLKYFYVFKKIENFEIQQRKSYYNMAQIATFPGGEPLFQNFQPSCNANFLNFYFFQLSFSGLFLSGPETFKAVIYPCFSGFTGEYRCTPF